MGVRLSLTDVGTPHEPLRVMVRLDVQHRHRDTMRLTERRWGGRQLDLLPSALMDLGSTFLWGEPGDLARSWMQAERHALRHRASTYDA